MQEMLDRPASPLDESLRNIIDKLAEFVARNGSEFEMITKQKQQNNPKFGFLYGGEFAAYYQYRVAVEQNSLKQQQQQQQNQMDSCSNQVQLQTQGQQQQQTHPPFTQAPPPKVMITSSGTMPVITEHNAQQQQHYAMNQPPPNHQLWNANATAATSHSQHKAIVGAATNPKSAVTTKTTTGTNVLAMNITAQIEAINIQQNTLREQIRQSESNLTAQHTALMAQQKKQIDEAIEAAQNAQLEKQAEENQISLDEMNAVLQPIIDSCTKDSISAGKNWILQHSSDSAKNNVVLQYLLKKALVNGSTFQQKLHLIYLINDILHHCVRKSANDLKNSLENVVIPMFCSADLIANSEQRAKLTKLLSLWESKAKFFDACVISKLQSPDSSMQEYKTNLQNLHHDVTSEYALATKTQLDNYQKQHTIFIQHATQQITQLEQQKQQMEQQMLATVMPNTAIMPPTVTQQQQQGQQKSIPMQNQIPSLLSQQISSSGGSLSANGGTGTEHQHESVTMYQGQQQQLPPPGADLSSHYLSGDQMSGNFFIPDLSKPPPGFVAPTDSMQNNMGRGMILGGTLPPNQVVPSTQYVQQMSGSNGSVIPPMSMHSNVTAQPLRSNGGDILNAGSALNLDVRTVNAALKLVQHQQQQMQHHHLQQQNSVGALMMAGTEAGAPGESNENIPPCPRMHIIDMEEQTPSAAYYDLPAGLMVPLIRLEDYKYKPLDPTEIRLPPPAPQSERLTNALAAFYSMPTHDRPRDNEGWEKLGLYEYYKVKNAAKKQKEEEIKNGTREKSRSVSPIILERPKPKKINKRCYRSKSRSRSRSPYRSRSRSRTRTRSRSPPVRSSSNRDKSSRGNSNRYSGGRSRSPRLRSSPPNRERGDREREKDRERDRDRDRDNNSSSSNRENRDKNSNRRERERSITPPTFFGNNLSKTNEFIEESNKGHQILMKMGWAGSGTGLGTKNQGIDQPISTGEPRDRKDLYKGVGVNLNDPFENFRKNKGAAFVFRMRSRDDKS